MSYEHNVSDVIAREQCPNCAKDGKDRSGDNLAIYDDGHSYCFACGFGENGPKKREINSVTEKKKKSYPLVKGGRIPANGIPSRKLDAATCKKYNYKLIKMSDGINHIAPYYKDGQVVAQKIRKPNKDFRATGNLTNDLMFGQHLFPKGRKRVIVAEGEIDAMTCYQALRTVKYQTACVSVPHGAAAAFRSFKANIDWLNSFEEVIICFDMDDAGRKAAQKCVAVLKPGKGRIAELTHKDANDVWLKDGREALKTQLYEAKESRPDGLVHISDVKPPKALTTDVLEYPWPKVTSVLFGREATSLVLHTSGPGMGKSTILRELMNHDLRSGYNVGGMFLEESCYDTKLRLIELELQKPVQKIMLARRVNAQREATGREPIEFDIVDDLTDEQYNDAVSAVDKLPLTLYDHFGSMSTEDLINRLEVMAHYDECQVIYLDHVSIVVSGRADKNERQEIDVLLTELRSFVQRTGVRLEAVSHLKRPDKGKSFNEGGTINAQQLRGSGALEQLSNSVYAYQRNQQDDDEIKKNTIIMRSLKDRLTGYTGFVAGLYYNPETCTLQEVDIVDDEVVIDDPTEIFE